MRDRDRETLLRGLAIVIFVILVAGVFVVFVGYIMK